jgi:hypothetical protein
MAHPPLHFGEALGATRAAFSRSFARPDLLSWLVANLLAERERWLLWLPVGLGAGIATYFGLPLEPPVWLGATGLLPATLLLAWSAWRLPAHAFHSCAPSLLGLVVFLLGFTVATLRTHLVEAPALDRRAAYELEATVLLVEERIRGQRLLLGELNIDGLEANATPARIRVSTRSAEPAFEPGDRIRLRALLMAPSPPVEPGGFDYARQAWFESLGAVGYGLAAPELLSRADHRGWSLGLAAFRQTIAHEITLAVPGTADSIGVALLTGPAARCRIRSGTSGRSPASPICCPSPDCTWPWSPAPCSLSSVSRWRSRRRSPCGFRPRSWQPWSRCSAPSATCCSRGPLCRRSAPSR